MIYANCNKSLEKLEREGKRGIVIDCKHGANCSLFYNKKEDIVYLADSDKLNEEISIMSENDLVNLSPDTDDNPIYVILTKSINQILNIPAYYKVLPLKDGSMLVFLLQGYIEVMQSDGTYQPIYRFDSERNLHISDTKKEITIDLLKDFKVMEQDGYSLFNDAIISIDSKFSNVGKSDSTFKLKTKREDTIILNDKYIVRREQELVEEEKILAKKEEVRKLKKEENDKIAMAYKNRLLEKENAKKFKPKKEKKEKSKNIQDVSGAADFTSMFENM